MFFKKSSIVKIVAAGFAVAASSAHAAGSVVDQIFGAIDLTTVAVAVGTLGVTIIGIAMGMKGISLAKRAVNKA